MEKTENVFFIIEIENSILAINRVAALLRKRRYPLKNLQFLKSDDPLILKLILEVPNEKRLKFQLKSQLDRLLEITKIEEVKNTEEIFDCLLLKLDERDEEKINALVGGKFVLSVLSRKKGEIFCLLAGNFEQLKGMEKKLKENKISFVECGPLIP